MDFSEILNSSVTAISQAINSRFGTILSEIDVLVKQNTKRDVQFKTLSQVVNRMEDKLKVQDIKFNTLQQVVIENQKDLRSYEERISRLELQTFKLGNQKEELQMILKKDLSQLTYDLSSHSIIKSLKDEVKTSVNELHELASTVSYVQSANKRWAHEFERALSRLIIIEERSTTSHHQIPALEQQTKRIEEQLKSMDQLLLAQQANLTSSNETMQQDTLKLISQQALTNTQILSALQNLEGDVQTIRHKISLQEDLLSSINQSSSETNTLQLESNDLSGSKKELPSIIDSTTQRNAIQAQNNNSQVLKQAIQKINKTDDPELPITQQAFMDLLQNFQDAMFGAVSDVLSEHTDLLQNQVEGALKEAQKCGFQDISFEHSIINTSADPDSFML
ncbi:hypothetical protein CROQUDRAFT_712793 [Cronartium quercuum f. sp. fusiforme G11]|uniref:Uncharacterized protein n=1 Tax=Cronartium quercuum f. sp. fusiforme G11 TaxID=708437 RepID=A0A9P6NQN8_9BASI|nr:hypothetical protein CROQUDRAFT_712793 [Cronartium quercuum f. sp. fusiforme G11]